MLLLLMLLMLLMQQHAAADAADAAAAHDADDADIFRPTGANANLRTLGDANPVSSVQVFPQKINIELCVLITIFYNCVR